MAEDVDPLARAITAANLLDTTVYLCAKACELAAQTGAKEEWEQHADYVATCLSRPVQTRVMARDFMAVASMNARRRIGSDDDLGQEQYVVALRLVEDFEERVLARMDALACRG